MIFMGKLEGKRSLLKTHGIDGRIIFRSIFRKRDGAPTLLILIRIGTAGRHL
jgi:hypothetical protein